MAVVAMDWNSIAVEGVDASYHNFDASMLTDAGLITKITTELTYNLTSQLDVWGFRFLMHMLSWKITYC